MANLDLDLKMEGIEVAGVATDNEEFHDFMDTEYLDHGDLGIDMDAYNREFGDRLGKIEFDSLTPEMAKQLVAEAFKDSGINLPSLQETGQDSPELLAASAKSADPSLGLG